jgi:hypothetical protein
MIHPMYLGHGASSSEAARNCNHAMAAVIRYDPVAVRPMAEGP